ncbi:MAG: sulfatase, partial [Verrucomicrobiota bacterium]
RHYVQSPTCGASRYTLLTGQYGSSSNHALFQRAKKIAEQPESIPPSMPHYFRNHGYTTVSVGKVSHHPGGRGGPNWDKDSEKEMPLSWDRHLLPAKSWQHPRGSMHGLANGEIRVNAGDMDVYQAAEGDDSIYPDGPITDVAQQELETLINDDKPFFLAVGIIRPHLPFGAPANYLEPYQTVKLPPIPHPNKPEHTPSTYHKSGEFMKYNRWGKNPNTDPDFATEVRKHYAACVTYADALIGRIVDQLAASPEADNTIIVIWGDHGWHLGEHGIWGKHALFEESLHSPLIIVAPQGPNPGSKTKAVVETLDVFPTLTELAGLPKPDYAQGVSLVPIMEQPASSGHSAFAYRSSNKTVRTETHRLIDHGKKGVELFDLSGKTPAKNVAADYPEIVEKLKEQISQRFSASNN